MWYEPIETLEGLTSHCVGTPTYNVWKIRLLLLTLLGTFISTQRNLCLLNLLVVANRVVWLSHFHKELFFNVLTYLLCKSFDIWLGWALFSLTNIMRYWPCETFHVLISRCVGTFVARTGIPAQHDISLVKALEASYRVLWGHRL